MQKFLPLKQTQQKFIKFALFDGYEKSPSGMEIRVI